MAFIDKNLLPDERIEYKAKTHWWVFARPLFFLIVSIICFSSLDFKANAGPSPAWLIGGLVSVLLVFTSSISNILYYISTELGVSNKRVLIKTGFIRRESVELMLEKVEHLHVRQPVFGRIVGYGFLDVAGAGNTNSYKFISNPFEFRKQIQMQVENIKRSS